jgi:hypothetical protein
MACHPLIDAIADNGFGLVDVWEISPERLEEPDACYFLQRLFPGDPFLCVETSALSIVRRSKIKQPEAVRSIVPNPIDFENDHQPILTRRFIIFDGNKNMTFDKQASVLLYLNELLPVTMIVGSPEGNLQGWFFCERMSDNMLSRFFATCCRFGADSGFWDVSKPARMPDAGDQPVYYFAPKTIKDAQ